MVQGLEDIAIEASEIVSRLEQVAEGLPTLENNRSHSTVFLDLVMKNSDEIVQIIHSLISSADDSEPLRFPRLDSVTKLVIVSHSLATYCGGLERPILQKLSTRFTTDTTRWICQLFGSSANSRLRVGGLSGFGGSFASTGAGKPRKTCNTSSEDVLDCSAFYHEDHFEGLVRVTRMMLHYKYPRYLEDGALALTHSLPTIYSSVASPLGVVQHLCRQLGLPLSCIRPVPINTHFGPQYTMDISAMQKMLTDDVTSGRTPLIVIADAGTPISGHVDNIPRIKELCKVHGVWLHLRGHSLSALALPNHRRNGLVPPVSDSLTLTLGSWLGIPGLPMVTLYSVWDSSVNSYRSKQVGGSRESTLPLLAGLSTDHHCSRILSIPLWVALQGLGVDGVHSRIKENFMACEKLWLALDVFRHVRVLSSKPEGESGIINISELGSKLSTSSLLFTSTVSCVVFQFTPEPNGEEFISKVPAYYDKLNSWLGQILQLDAPQVPIDICELENIGVVLRFCPFENATGQKPTSEDIQTFVQCLEQQLVILRATVQHRDTFIHLVKSSTVLKIVELPDWAGMGGVRYCPDGWEQLLTDQAKEELNRLNVALVDSLRATDSAFSLGEDADGLMCVRFGMLTPQSDVEELLNLVLRVGQSVEENSRVLDSMSEIVKKGIETATMDLQKECEERLWQENIIRHVPIVGTFVNWWSPKTKDASGIRGRSLNLTQGVVESTENIYKYHMQVQTGRITGSGGKTPPTPQIQTPVNGSHSRSSSHTSASGQLPNIKMEDKISSNSSKMFIETSKNDSIA